MNIDQERCLSALCRINVVGYVGEKSTIRLEAIEDAITAIQTDPVMALSGHYIGVKNYASFGDQRNDGKSGTGPRHGSIVFRISRAFRDDKDPLGPEHIYLLECVRDAGAFPVFEHDPYASKNSFRNRELNLAEVLSRWKNLSTLADAYAESIADCDVETHEEVKDAF